MDTSPKTYHGNLTRGGWRMLYVFVSRARPENRSHERWLLAADEALVKLMDMEEDMGTITFKPVQNPKELITSEVPADALKGIKFAAVKAMAGSSWSERKVTLGILASGFGKKLSDMVSREAKLPEGDADDDMELEGI